MIQIKKDAINRVTNQPQKPGHINSLAVLKGFFKLKKRLPVTELLFGPESSGCNNKVTVLMDGHKVGS